MSKTAAFLLIALLSGIALLAAIILEGRTAGLSVDHRWFGPTPVTILRSSSGSPQDIVVISHGIGGSRQMMMPIAVTVARAGYAVVLFDYVGHGRNPVPISPDVTRITGTTAQLVKQTIDVVRSARALPEPAEPSI